MVMIRPVLRANDDRKHNVHVVVFFIFLVSNIGGSLTPLGDPPLFLGFLRGVDFFWTTQHLLPETLLTAGIVLAAVLRPWTRSSTGAKDTSRAIPTPDRPIRVIGGINMLLGAVIIVAILLSAKLKLGTFSVLGTEVAVQNLLA